MAVEYQGLRYAHLPRFSPATAEDPDQEFASLAEGSQSNVVEPTQLSVPSTRLIFVPNFLHDLESVIWQYLRILHFRVPLLLVKDKSDASLAKYRKFLGAIKHSQKFLFFQGIDGSIARYEFIRSTIESENLRRKLEALYGKNSPFLGPFCLLRDLRGAYTRAERAKPVDILGDNGMAVVDDYGVILQRLPISAFDTILYLKMITIFKGLKNVKCALRDIAEWAAELDHTPIYIESMRKFIR